MSAFSEYVTQAARAAGYSLDGPRSGGRTALAAASGLSLTTVGRALAGSGDPDPYLLPKLAAALSVPVEVLLRLVGILPDNPEADRLRIELASSRSRALLEGADELLRVADVVEAKVAEAYGPASGIGPGSAAMVREAAYTLRGMAGKDTGGGTQPPAGESTQPAPAQVWHVFDEDTGQPLPPLFTTRAAAEQGTIDRYQAAGEYSPDYSWRPGEDGSHELLAGGDPVGIYLTPVAVNGDTATQPAPDTDASTAFMQLGTTLSLAGLRAELHIEGHPPIIGRYCGFGSRRLEPGVLLIEPTLLFHWADDDITEGEVPRG